MTEREWAWRHLVPPLTPAFIAPALYEQYQTTNPVAIDEYTLSMALVMFARLGRTRKLTRSMGDDLREKMEEHYKTFIVRVPDIRRERRPTYARPSRTLPRSPLQVSTGSGELAPIRSRRDRLLTRRIPIGYWAIETLPEEPFLEGVSWA